MASRHSLNVKAHALRAVLAAALLWPALAAAGQPFPRPPELARDVDFWKRIYTEVDTSSGLLHDTRNLSVVYTRLDFAPDTSRRARQRKVDAAKRHYRAILRQLASGHRRELNREQRRVLNLWPKGVSNATLRGATHRLRFQLGQRDKFRAGLVRSGLWAPYIRHAFAARGLPTELSLLPHVESSFNPEAYSHLGAAGMWQFIRSTGRRFLRLDHVVDERLDPFASTDAAVELLAHNYAVTGTWPLALTAYNHGTAGIRRAVKKLGTRDIATIARRYNSRTFGFASRNFYVAFLAAVEVHRNAETYFPGVQLNRPAPLRTVTVPDFIPVAKVVRALGVERETLRAHNRMLLSPVWRGDKRVPAGYALRLPPGPLGPAQAAARIAAIPATQRFARQVPDTFHVVRRGQTLSGIASRYGLSLRALRQNNQLASAHFIRVGQRLRLPLPAGVNAAPRAMPANERYRVRRGDTLLGIAERFGIDSTTLLKANRLRNADRIYPGQVLALALASEQASRETPDPPSEATLPKAEAAAATAESEPAVGEARESSAVEADAQAGTSVAHAAPSADPSDYEVAADGTIEVQAAETLGHYAHWLAIPTQRLRDLNSLRFGKPVAIGQRLRLDLARVAAERFTARRMAFHEKLQARFFARYRIQGTHERAVRLGDSLWRLARRERGLPVWLLRQYNPDLDFASLHPGTHVLIPQLSRRQESGESPS